MQTPDINQKFLIIHIDDIGICHSANQAAFAVLTKGLAKTGSVMVVCPWVMEVVHYVRDNPSLDLGLHLTLNSEWPGYRWGPIAPRDSVKGLVDPLGYFWPTRAATMQHATTREVEIELNAQIEQALKLGFKPSHLDCHMGIALFKTEWLKILLKLGKIYDIPVSMVRWSEELGEQEIKRRGLPVEHIRTNLLHFEAQGGLLIDHLTTAIQGFSYAERKQHYFDFLNNLKPGVTQINIHPGLDQDEMATMMRDIKGAHSKRFADYLIFTDDETQQRIAELGIKLIGWRDFTGH